MFNRRVEVGSGTHPLAARVAWHECLGQRKPRQSSEGSTPNWPLMSFGLELLQARMHAHRVVDWIAVVTTEMTADA